MTLHQYYQNILLQDSPITLRLALYSVPKGRPRFAGTHTYTPKATKDFEDAVATHARTKVTRPYACPVSVSIIIQIAVPKSYSTVKKELAMHNLITPLKGDLDNRVKAITDALNGIAYYDDVQIAYLSAQKFYWETDLITVTVSRIGLHDLEIDRYKKLKKASHDK